MKRKANIAVVGCGHWGKNLIRNFYELGVLESLYDSKVSQLEKFYDIPAIRYWNNYDSLLGDKDIKAVAIATPAQTHYIIAKDAILAGKDVFVEKPLACTYACAKELVELAEENKTILMVGHLLNYHPAIIKLKEIIEKNRLGKINYIQTTRMNYREERPGESVLHDLASHDVSVIMNLLGGEAPRDIKIERSFFKEQIPEVASMNLYFKSGKEAYVFVSWYDPKGERKIRVVGSKRMAIFDDLANEKLKLYSYKDGEHIVKVISYDETEPLRLECQHFVECIKERKKPLTSGTEGIKVLRVLLGREGTR